MSPTTPQRPTDLPSPWASLPAVAVRRGLLLAVLLLPSPSAAAPTPVPVPGPAPNADGVAAGATATSAPGESASPDTVDLGYYLAALPGGEAAHDPTVPAPQEVLGFQVGHWHARPDQIVAYLERLAAASDRVKLEETGRTYERKPQVLATITSAANQARLDEILAAHRRLSEPPFDADAGADGDAAGAPIPDDMPAVVYLGYSIHGNEASGANASMVVAYHLASSQSPEVRALLDRVVVLLDPELNPDGLGRFAHWANMYRGAQAVADPNDREHIESWPSGRTNHYWFDLNRDWLLLVHPESRNRVRVFQRWRPNVLADFHEMGSRSTYFFQPGVPSRQNPLTPQKNLDLTREFARYHARALDKAGSLYFSEETFDDFYFGKGSTYPDVQGTIGILFEQASARGHLQEGQEGERAPITFPFAIRNQAMTSFSTLQAAADHRADLLDYQRGFYRDALAEAADAPVQAYVVGSAGDGARLQAFTDVLRRHGIRAYHLAHEVNATDALGEAHTFQPDGAVVVPVRQRQTRLLRALFERWVDFQDTTFYDVSAWTLPFAFDLPWAELDAQAFRGDLEGEPLGAPGETAGAIPAADEPPPAGAVEAPGSVAPVAWAFEWTGTYAPRTLGRLLRAGVYARVATRPFEAPTPDGVRGFDYGTVVIPVGLQREREGEIRSLLATGAREDGTQVYALTSGLTPDGIDLGSPSLRPLEEPKAMIVIGDGVSSYAAGEIWYLLDRRFGLEVSLVDRSTLPQVDLDRYTHIILVDGSWQDLSEAEVAALDGWVRAGGTLIGIQRGATWAEHTLLGMGDNGEPGSIEINLQEHHDGVESRPYAAFRDDVAVPLIAGTIFKARIDRTHPLGYGFGRDLLPVFRDTTLTLEESGNPYDTPVRYTAKPLLAGYVSADNLERLADQPAVIASRVERGLVIRMVDDPSFRGIWYGTSRLMMNAIFFSPAIERTIVPEGVEPEE